MDTLKRARQYENANRVLQGEKPVFHAVPPIGWMNDPNGFCVYQEKIHLFYQYYPYGTDWGPTHWGHMMTEDMIRWEDRPAVLAPDQAYDQEGCFSGSAIETEEGHALIYTGVAKDQEGTGVVQSQCVAIGDGTDYEKIAENPVITGDMLPDGLSCADFRDPKIWKDEETGHYMIVVGTCDEDRNGQIVLFSGKDLTHWSYEGILACNEGALGRIWECPDFFELEGKHVLLCSPQDMRAVAYEFHNGYNSLYFLGDYDRKEKRFSKGEARSLDYGLDFYAAQTTCLPDGRRVLIAWMQSWDTTLIPIKPKWRGMMTLPRELSIRNGRLFQSPIRELERYRKNQVRYGNETIEGEKRFDGICGRVIDLTIEIKSGNFDELVIDTARDEEYHTRFAVNRKKSLLEIDRTYSGFIKDIVCIRRVEIPTLEESMTLRFIMDRNSIELFINGGEKVCSTVIYTPLSAQEILFSCDGSAVIDIEKHDIVL